MKIQLKGWGKNLLLVLLGVVLGYLLLLGPLFWLSMRLPQNDQQAYQAGFCRERLQKTIYPALMNYLKIHNRQFPKGWRNQEAFQKDLASQLASSLDLQCPFQAMTACRAYRFNFGLAGERLEDLRNPEKFFTDRVWLVKDWRSGHNNLLLMLDGSVKSSPRRWCDLDPWPLCRRAGGR